MAEDNVSEFKPRQGVRAAVLTVSPRPLLPPGPFTVTISDAGGKMFEVVLPDAGGELPADGMIMGTVLPGGGEPELLVNLLTGALRAFAGRSVLP